MVPDETYFERRGLSADTVEKLEAMGITLRNGAVRADLLKESSSIREKNGRDYGATDPRGYGLAVRY